MAISEVKGKVVDVKLWLPLEELEPEAQHQIFNVAKLPWVFKHVAVMPDAHFGRGCTVGTVIAMKNAVAPSAVGVDLGCGMGAIKTNLKASDLPDNLHEIRHDIERSIPVGFNGHKSPCFDSVENINYEGNGFQFKEKYERLSSQFTTLKAPRLNRERVLHQLGTLGGGNHFIELCVDTEQTVWLVLHSGSRNAGKEIAEHHIKIAKKLSHNHELPDPDLAVFLSDSQEMHDYRNDLWWAQNYAYINRELMMRLYFKQMKRRYPHLKATLTVNCHHNYVSEEKHYGEDVLVTRKGAINAEFGNWGIIPGSMGTKSYIVQGLGNPESFNSASHGAGRRMSRGKAKKTFTLEDLAKQTEGVECRKDQGVLDEIPGAYKDIDKVMEYQKDLVQVRHELKQVMCIKG
jgi:tRNA-splicing ligase RtcB